MKGSRLLYHSCAEKRLTFEFAEPVVLVSDHHLGLGEPERLRAVVGLTDVLQNLPRGLGVSPLVRS